MQNVETEGRVPFWNLLGWILLVPVALFCAWVLKFVVESWGRTVSGGTDLGGSSSDSGGSYSGGDSSDGGDFSGGGGDAGGGGADGSW